MLTPELIDFWYEVSSTHVGRPESRHKIDVTGDYYKALTTGYETIADNPEIHSVSIDLVEIYSNGEEERTLQEELVWDEDLQRVVEV